MYELMALKLEKQKEKVVGFFPLEKHLKCVQMLFLTGNCIILKYETVSSPAKGPNGRRNKYEASTLV